MDLTALSDDELQEKLFTASHDLLTAEPLNLALDRFWELAHESDRRDAERDQRLAAPGALGAAARWYAGQGIAVFPLKPGDKRPYPGSRGFKDATTDPATIAGRWAAAPLANIGVPTGHLFDVIDVDGPAGYQSAADLREAGQLPPVLGKVYTPRGGRHLYVPASGDGNATRFRAGLDYRGNGGYVVAPPSTVGGRRYAWLVPLALGTGP